MNFLKLFQKKTPEPEITTEKLPTISFSAHEDGEVDIAITIPEGASGMSITCLSAIIYHLVTGRLTGKISKIIKESDSQIIQNMHQDLEQFSLLDQSMLNINNETPVVHPLLVFKASTNTRG